MHGHDMSLQTTYILTNFSTMFAEEDYSFLVRATLVSARSRFVFGAKTTMRVKPILENVQNFPVF